eukprot:6196814-Pleurochrysis_carterae.AAC.2
MQGPTRALAHCQLRDVTPAEVCYMQKSAARRLAHSVVASPNPLAERSARLFLMLKRPEQALRVADETACLLCKRGLIRPRLRVRNRRRHPDVCMCSSETRHRGRAR